jgi:hypothetical protein
MNRLRPFLTPRKAEDTPNAGGARDVFRRFFALIERFELPLRRNEARVAPEVKARITRLDDEPHRHA